jgi:transcriptional regulator with XRE-family HTH domain
MGGKKVKIEMIKREISQTELAKRLGLSLPHLNLIINGRRKTRWIQEAIARELNVKVEDLFGESESH